MTIADTLDARLKQAMRDKDRRTLDVIRQVRTEAQTARTAPGFTGDEDDAFYRRVITAYVKKIRKARDEYLALGDRGADMAGKLGFEVDYLAEFLPRTLDEAATRALVTEAITATGASGPKDVGKVMGHIMKAHREQVDSALVKRLTDQLLTPTS